MRATLALSTFAMLIGCAQSDAVRPSPKTDPIPFRLDARGIQLTDRAQRVDFGRTDHSAQAAMTKLVGEGPVSRAVCGDGSPFVTWPDGSSLYFRNGAFEGWQARSADGAVQTGGRTCA